MDIAGFDFLQVIMQDFRHRGAGDKSALLGQAAVCQIAAGVLGVGQVDVGDNVHDAPVGLLGKALVLAAVSRLHMENRNVETLCPDDGEAGIGISQYQHRIRL